MSEKSNIAWTDSTVNFWSGCTKVSAGCANCYAEARDARMMQEPVTHWGNGVPRLKHTGAVKQALAMNRNPWICDQTGDHLTDEQFKLHPDGTGGLLTYHRRRIFSLSLGDWLDAEVPIEWLAEALDTIQQCGQVTWILCTKRPENFEKQIYAARLLAYKNKNEALEEWIHKWAERCDPPKNIILLTSVENQEQADKRIPELLKIPAACHGLSMEPLLGPVDLSGKMSWGNPHNSNTLSRPIMFDIDWLIIGGESGRTARCCNVDWIRSIVAQGKAAGVATFVKQFGRNVSFGDGYDHCQLGHQSGADPAEWPPGDWPQNWPKGF